MNWIFLKKNRTNPSEKLQKMLDITFPFHYNNSNFLRGAVTAVPPQSHPVLADESKQQAYQKGMMEIIRISIMPFPIFSAFQFLFALLQISLRQIVQRC